MNDAVEKGRLLAKGERLDPSRTALMLIDIQNEFCHPDGAFAKLGNDVSMMATLVNRARLLLEVARRRQMLIFFVRATYDSDVLSGPLAETYVRRGFPDSQCHEGSWAADWFSDLAPNPSAHNEVVITKHRFSVFWGTDVDVYLRANDIKSLVFAGVVTSGCVESSLRDAFFRDYYVTIAKDAVAEASVERHNAALAKIGQAFGAVMDAKEIATVWNEATSHGRSVSAEAKGKVALTDLAGRLDPRHTALALIDFQVDFCHPEGAISQTGEDVTLMQEAAEEAKHLLRAARAAGMRVVHIRAEYGDADASPVSIFSSHSVSGTLCCRPGTKGAAFLSSLTPRPSEWVVTKHRFSAFVDTRLDLLLRSNGIRTLIVCGVATQCCVESTVRDAAMRDYYVVVAKQGVAARRRMSHLHEASLETMALYFADCRDVSEILGAIDGRGTVE